MVWCRGRPDASLIDQLIHLVARHPGEVVDDHPESHRDELTNDEAHEEWFALLARRERFRARRPQRATQGRLQGVNGARYR